MSPRSEVLPPDQAVRLLGGTRLFHDLDPEDVERLAGRAVLRHVDRGQPIFDEGDPGDSLMVVARGRVKVYVTSRDGDQMILVTIGPAEVFGELSLVDGGARSASAEALEDTALLVVTRDAFLALLADRPHLVERLLVTLGRVVRRVTDQAADLVFLDLHGRVAKLLVTLADEQGGEIIDLGLNQTDLAQMVGGSRQSVNQILRSLEVQGLVDVDGRRVRILRPERLRHRAGIG